VRRCVRCMSRMRRSIEPSISKQRSCWSQPSGVCCIAWHSCGAALRSGREEEFEVAPVCAKDEAVQTERQWNGGGG